MGTRRQRLTKEERLVVYRMYDGHCAYCGAAIELKDMQVDHIIPVYKDGQNEIENYRPTCRMCNFYKSTMPVEKFREQLMKIPERLNREFSFRLAVKYGLITVNDKHIVFKFEEERK